MAAPPHGELPNPHRWRVADEDLVDDAWTSLTKKMPIVNDAGPNAAELADFAKMEEIRARVDAIVTDAATAEALKPWYG